MSTQGGTYPSPERARQIVAEHLAELAAGNEPTEQCGRLAVILRDTDDNGDTDGIDVRSTGMTTDKLHAAEASRLAADLDTLGSILAAMGATVANGAVTCPHPAMVTASEAALIEQLTRAHS